VGLSGVVIQKSDNEVYDIHATILHQLGIDHKKLSVRHNGTEERLTSVHGHKIKEMIQ
jgi:hypothetical protein